MTALWPSSGSARTSCCRVRVWAASTRSTASPSPSPFEETLPAQAVAGSRVDVWVALPDTRNGFAQPTLLLPGAEIAQVTPGSTALGSSRSTVVMVLVPDAQMPNLLGAQANKAKISVVWNPRRCHMSIPVVTVGDSPRGPGWRTGTAPRAGLRGPAGAAELAELLAACQSGLARAAVVAAGSEELTASLVDRLSAVGVVVIALTDNPEETARLAASAWQPNCRPSMPQPWPHAFPQRWRSSVAPEQRPGPAAAGTAPRPSPPPVQGRGASGGARPRRGAGREGAGSLRSGGRPVRPGRTLVAANIAGELAAEGKSVLLVDADSYGASVAALLGLLDEAAGLAQACRLADQGLLDARRPAQDRHARGRPRPGTLPGADRHHAGGPLDRTPRRGTHAGAGAGPGDRGCHCGGHRLLPRSR